ncbi:MAG: hypothetical protein KQI62_02155 [Deltaproteobacteria bacterium]|nr:hypothetical protein [Deltaproteobacteria bacterium]
MRPEKVDILTGWQEIADELNTTVRKAQRWEKQFGLPVDRKGRSGRLITTSRAALQAWVDGGNQKTSGGR